jgi:hypothetical protein
LLFERDVWVYISSLYIAFANSAVLPIFYFFMSMMYSAFLNLYSFLQFFLSFGWRVPTAYCRVWYWFVGMIGGLPTAWLRLDFDLGCIEKCSSVKYGVSAQK